MSVVPYSSEFLGSYSLEQSLFRGSYVLLWCGRHFSFHILSITVLFSVLNSHWQKLFLSDH